MSHSFTLKNGSRALFNPDDSTLSITTPLGEVQHSTLGRAESRLLDLLLAEPGVIKTREQIIEHTWNDRVVASGSLNQVVFSLRNLLNDSRDHDILMTIPRRGYRFNPLYVRNGADAEAAPTAIEPEPLTAPVAAAPAAPIKQPPNWLRLGYAFTLLMCLATLAHFSLSSKTPSIEVASTQRGNLTLSTLGSTQDQAQALGSAVDKQLHNLPRDLAGQVWIHQSKSNYSISCIRTDQTTRNLLFNPQQRQLADVLAQCLEVSL
ncbi:winged helix-turn-helix domain-containing protein [Pseudomonas fluorescens]|uniref:winged helix-turn-helix domain-containing protein n=1 Tax=Pseudomonas TaxID=286 RepID=UPI00211973AC|nr:helix-turn-helix domain-containing protein [Pseudomonas sp. Pse1]